MKTKIEQDNFIFDNLNPPRDSSDYKFINNFFETLEKGRNVFVDQFSVKDFCKIGGFFEWINFSYGITEIPDIKISNFSLTVCILTYNCSKWIEHTVLLAKKIADEIIIIDSSSTDDTISKIEHMVDIVIKIPNNIGFDKKRNIGIEKANNNWIFMLDSDEIFVKTFKLNIRKIISWAEIKEIDIIWLSRIWLKSFYLKPLKYYIGHHALWPDPQARIFKKDIKPYYSRPVHEILKSKDAKFACFIQNLECSLIHIKHWITNKYERNKTKKIRKNIISDGPDLIQYFPEKSGFFDCKNYNYDLYKDSYDFLTFLKDN